MRRLLIVGDSPDLYSGLARVTRELAFRFQRDGVEVVVAGHAHDVASRRLILPFIVSPATKATVPEQLFAQFRPDTVLAIGDPWDFAALAKYRAERPGIFKLVGYLNVEGTPLAPAFTPIIDAFDAIATTSEYGASVINRPGVGPIHHGVDREVFRPVKKLLALGGHDLTKTFVVLLNAQNTTRKNLPTAIRGFSDFAARHPQEPVLLYVNSSMRSPIGFDLADVVTELRIPNLVMFNPSLQEAHPVTGVPDEDVNLMYACADVLLVTSLAEGFCLPVLEAMATRTVPVATDGFSMAELLADHRGLLIPAAATFRGDRGAELPVVSAEDVANALDVVYDRWKAGSLADYHRAGMSFASSRPWERTYRLLNELIDRPVRARVADGNIIDPYLRMRAQSIAAQHPSAMAVVRIGGLTEHLTATAVIAESAAFHKRPVVVFANTDPGIYQNVPGVVAVSRLKTTDQAAAVRSIGDAFEMCVDLRTVSKIWGAPAVPFFQKHRAHYDFWPQSVARLADLGHHVIDVMLQSIGVLPEGMGSSLRPIYPAREGGPAFPARYICVASSGAAYGHFGQWPDEGWTALISSIEEMEAAVAIVQVGEAEDPLIPGVTMDARGESLPRTAAILADADLLVATEGPMAHLAASIPLPSVVMFGPVDPLLFGYRNQLRLSPMTDGEVICQPCWGMEPWWNAQTCARGLSVCVNFPSPTDVIEKVADLLRHAEEVRPGGSPKTTVIREGLDHCTVAEQDLERTSA